MENIIENIIMENVISVKVPSNLQRYVVDDGPWLVLTACWLLLMH